MVTEKNKIIPKKNIHLGAIFVLVLLTLLRIWFGNYIGNWIDAPTPHDDQWFLIVSQLRSYYSDSLDLGSRMLIKEMVFPYFLCFVRISHLSFSTAVSLIWILGASLTGVLSYQLVRKKTISCAVYVYFLWCPIAFELRAGTRIYRNSIIAPSILIAFCLAFIFLFMLLQSKIYKRFQYILVAITLGIVVFFTAYIKEDGAWLIACLAVISLLYLLIVVFRFRKNKQEIVSMLGISLLPIFLFFGLQSAYKLVNYVNFGVWATNTRTASELGNFTNNIYKIDSDNRTEIVWAPKDAIEKAFDASPTLQEHPELLDRIIHSGWCGGDIDSNPIEGDFFSWVLRDALVECGMWTSYQEVDELFDCINDELEEAFQTGILKEDSKFRLVASTGGRSFDEIVSLKDSTWTTLKGVITLNIYEPGATAMDPEKSKELGFEQYVTNTVLSYGDAYNRRIEETQAANCMIEKIFIFYKYTQAVAIVIGALGILRFFFQLIKKKNEDTQTNIWLLLSIVGLWSLSLVYSFAISWFITFIDADTWRVFYSSAMVPMIYLAETFGVLLFLRGGCFKAIKEAV